MKTKKTIPYLWLGPIITLAIMFALYAIAGIFPFGSNSTAISDGIAQYIPFLSELSNKIHEGGSLLFSWHFGGGSNFWATISYYLCNPLNLIALLFPANRMDDAFSLLTLIKPFFLALTFGVFLKKTYKKNDLSLVIFSVLWAMSNFMIAGINLTSWYDAIIYFPLVIMGLKKMMDGESAWVYSLFLGLTIACNFYIGWMTCIFCVIYLVYCFISDDGVVYEGTVTEAQQDEESESVNIFAVFKNSYLLGSLFKFALSSILAGGISAIMTLPTASALMYTGKGTVSVSTYNVIGDGFWGILGSHIIPVKNVFDTFTSRDVIFSFVGIATIILAIAYFFTKGISLRKKIGNLFVLVVMWASIIFHSVYFVWHGFGEPAGYMYRFAFIYSFVLLKIAYEAFAEIKNIPIYGILAGTTFSGLCLAGVYFNDVLKSTCFTPTVLVTAVAFIVAFTVVLLIASKKVQTKQIVTVALLVCIVAESMVLNLGNIKTIDVEENLGESTIVSELTKNVAENERVHFASKKQESFNDMIMYGAIFNFNSLESYSSMSNNRFAITATEFGTYGNRLNMQNGASEQSPVFNMFFPTDYYIDGTNNLSESFYRTKVTEKDGYVLYKNNYTLPFMYTVSGTIGQWNPFNYPIVIDNLNAAAKALTNTDDNIICYNSPQNFVYENCTHISAIERIEATNELLHGNADKNATTSHEGHDHDHDHEHSEAESEGTHMSANQYYEFLEKRMSGYSYEITDMTKPAYITFESVAEADGMMYLYVDTNEMTELKVTLNGKTNEYYLFGAGDDCTYELGEVKKGDIATITIGGYRYNGKVNDEKVYILEKGSFTTISYTVDKEKFENAYNTLDSMSDTELLEFEDTYVKANVTSYVDGALYIPTSYDEGWTILVDGVETPLYEHESHILMIPITAGEHVVEMKYSPVGFTAGAIITGVSALILVAWIVISTKRSKNDCAEILANDVSEE